MPKYLCRVVDGDAMMEVEANDRGEAAEVFCNLNATASAEYPKDGERIRVEVRNATGEPNPSIYRVMASHEINYYARAETPNDPDRC